jgi:ribose 5-phosphate isomerase RpiB
LINENSQASKNELICRTLKKVVEPMGHTEFNYGMYTVGVKFQEYFFTNCTDNKIAEYIKTLI